MTTISYSGGPDIAPTHTVIDSLAQTAQPRTVVHDILDGAPVHTLRPAAPMAGVLTLGFATEQAALDCLQSHRLATLFSIASTDRLALNFSYVVTGGNIGVEMQGPELWAVTVPYVEVI